MAAEGKSTTVVDFCVNMKMSVLDFTHPSFDVAAASSSRVGAVRAGDEDGAISDGQVTSAWYIDGSKCPR
jgi:hypothetical protein